MKLNFKIDIEKDFENYYNAVNDKERFGMSSEDRTKGISPKLKNLLYGNSLEEAKEKAMPILKKSYDKYEIYFRIFLRQVEEYWKLIGEEFIKRFEELTKKKFGFEEVDIYITTISRCPYSFREKWFMISFLNQQLYCIKIMAHELMHFHFLEHEWQRVNNEISEEKTENLKEAFTALLNLEFKDLLFFEDKGYPAHQELRKFIAQEWKKEKDYDKLLIKCMEFLKYHAS